MSTDGITCARLYAEEILSQGSWSPDVVLADQGTLRLVSSVAGQSLKAESPPLPITPLLLILLSSSPTTDHASSQFLPQLTR